MSRAPAIGSRRNSRVDPASEDRLAERPGRLARRVRRDRGRIRSAWAEPGPRRRAVRRAPRPRRPRGPAGSPPRAARGAREGSASGGARGARRGGAGPTAERHQGETALPGRVDAEEGVHQGIGEPEEHPGRDVNRHRGREEVRQQRAGVPEEVPERPRPVLPGVPPVDRREDRGGRRVGDEVLPARRVRERRAMIARPEAPQREVPGAEVVDARLEVRHGPGDDVDLGLIEGAGGRRRAEVDRLAAGVDLPLREAGREEEELRERGQVDRALPGRARRPRATASRAGSAGGGTSRGSGTAGASGYTLKRKGLFAQSSAWRSFRTLARECFVASVIGAGVAGALRGPARRGRAGHPRSRGRGAGPAPGGRGRAAAAAARDVSRNAVGSRSTLPPTGVPHCWHT